MIIALDFDGTYTRDPAAWNTFIQNMQREGHVVYCVTMRYPAGHQQDATGKEASAVEKALGHLVDGIHYTARKAKQTFMAERGIDIHVWIDDNPNWILTDALA